MKNGKVFHAPLIRVRPYAFQQALGNDIAVFRIRHIQKLPAVADSPIGNIIKDIINVGRIENHLFVS